MFENAEPSYHPVGVQLKREAVPWRDDLRRNDRLLACASLGPAHYRHGNATIRRISGATHPQVDQRTAARVAVSQADVQRAAQGIASAHGNDASWTVS